VTPHEGRLILETMVQSSTVDLFHSVGIAVAPIAASPRDHNDVASHALMSMIQFSSPGMTGTLGLLIPQQVFALVKQDSKRPFTGGAWVQESVNQLLGRMKSRLMQFRITLQMGLPMAMNEKTLKQIMSQGVFAAYHFRTLRGQVTVTLSGRIDFSQLDYAAQPIYASEGDIVIF
jgi:hypothetical protein